MDPLLKKLQFKGGRLTVLAAPDELGPVIARWGDEPEVTQVSSRLGKHETFVLCFVQSPADIERQTPRVTAAVPGDGVVWFAYPKKSSPRYNPELSRDEGWQVLGDAGWEPVRQVAIDEQWSAVRFRRVELIATMTRGRALTAAGKRRIAR